MQTNDPTLDEEIRRLMAAGASDEDIMFYIQNRNKTLLPQVETPVSQSEMPAKTPSHPLGQFGQGVVTGVKEGLKNTKDLALVAAEHIRNPLALGLHIAKKRAEPKQEPQSIYESAGKFLGTVVGEAPINILMGGAIRSVVKPVVIPAATKAGTFIKNFLANTPLNVAEGLISEGLLHPEDLNSKEAIARTGLISSAGAIFDAVQAVKKAPTDVVERWSQRFDPDAPPQVANQSLKTAAVVPPGAPADPIGVLIESKRPNPIGLTDAELHFDSKIDYNNAAAKDARKQKRYLLDTKAKRAAYHGTNFLRPIDEADQVAGDMAAKFLRNNIREELNIDERLYIPNGLDYTPGPESVRPMLVEILGLDDTAETADVLGQFSRYVHARQTLGLEEKLLRDTQEASEAAGRRLAKDVGPAYPNRPVNFPQPIDRAKYGTPFDLEMARSLVEDYETRLPHIKEIYERRWMPLMSGKVDMMEGYGLISAEAAKAFRANPHYASLSRSTFEGIPKDGFLKARDNPDSPKLVSDLIQTTMDNIRTVVRRGERNKILNQLLDAKQANPNHLTDDIIRIVSHKSPIGNSPEALAYLKTLPDDTPEVLKKALVEAFVEPPKGNGIYHVKRGGSTVAIQLNKELENSLDLMTARMKPLPTASNETTAEKLLLHPLRGVQKTEKAASHLYSVYRDMFAGGVPLDAIEVSMNARKHGLNFNPLTDPVRGFMTLYRSDKRLAEIFAAGGGTTFRYANPAAERAADSAEELARIARKHGVKLRLTEPRRAFREFVGNLSNASRAGVALKALENGRSVREAATIYNTILGDPYKTGALTVGLSRVTSFFNYPIQANLRSIESYGAGGLALTLARGAGMLTAPTALIWYLNKDDEEIRKLRMDEGGRRFLYYRNPITGSIEAMRKPFLHGALFMTPVEQMLDNMMDSGETDAIEQIVKGISQELMPNYIPLTASLAYSLASGQSLSSNPFERGVPIIPGGRRNMLPEDQADAQASNASRLMSKLTGVSAGRFENVLRTFAIGTSYDMIQALDDKVSSALGVTSAKPKSFNRVNSRAFLGMRDVNEADVGRKYEREFYKNVEKYSAITNSLTNAENNGAIDRIQDIISTHAGDLARADAVASFKRDIDSINEMINFIKYNEIMSPEEKREQFTMLVRMRRDLAETAMKVIESME